ncbi:MAG: hypothetical protein WBX25_24125 [Rhodomicrobium sp.]
MSGFAFEGMPVCVVRVILGALFGHVAAFRVPMPQAMHAVVILAGVLLLRAMTWMLEPFVLGMTVFPALFAPHFQILFPLLAACLLAIAIASPSGTPDLSTALACLAAFFAAGPLSFLLCFSANSFPVQGMAT